MIRFCCCQHRLTTMWRRTTEVDYDGHISRRGDNRLRGLLTAAPVSSDGRYGRAFGKPGPRRLQCSIRQQGDRLSALQIANNRAVCLAAPECEVINADDMELFMPINRTPPYYPQKCILARGLISCR